MLSFHLLMVSFAAQKLLSSVRSHLFSFTFVSFALEDMYPTNVATVYVKECSMFSSGVS